MRREAKTTAMIPHDALELAALYALRDYLKGRVTLPADSAARVRALLRPFVPLGGLLMPVLGLDAAIAELEGEFPEAAQAAHLTHVAPAGLC